MSDFKVGDRVRIVTIYGADHTGKVGNLVAINDGASPFRVRIPGSNFAWHVMEVAHVDAPPDRPAEAQPRNRDVSPLDDDTIYRCMGCSETMTGWSVNQRRENPGKCYCGGSLDTADARANRIADRTRPAEAQAMSPFFERQIEALRPLVEERMYPKLTAAGKGTYDRLLAEYAPPPAPALVDPLDVEYDGVRLECLIARYELNQRENERENEHLVRPFQFTPAQRAAVSAHWSAALRAKVAASAEDERNRVTYSEVEPWE